MKNPLYKVIERIIVEAFEDHGKRNELISVYSDVYKEKHGIRPRWMMDRLDAMSDEQLQTALDQLMDEPETVDYDDLDDLVDLAIPGPHEPLALAADLDELEPDDFSHMPKHAAMGQRHHPKTRLHGPNVNKR
jgi:hypothetical protein